MRITLSHDPDQAIRDYTIILLQFCGFFPITTNGLTRVYQSQFNLLEQSDLHTVQQHLSLAVAVLYLLENGIHVSIQSDQSEKFHMIRCLSNHRVTHCLLAGNPSVVALEILG